MSTILPRPTFLRLPPDPKGRTRPETLLSLTSIEQVRWIPAAEGRPAELQLAAINGASARADQTVKGTDAEALWAQLQALHEAEWRAVQLSAQAPGLRAGLGQALALMNGAAVEPAEERAASAAAPGAGAALDHAQALAIMGRTAQADQEWREEAMRAIGNLTRDLQHLRQGIAALLPTPADFPQLQTDEALLAALRDALLPRTAGSQS